jgi:ADP-ribosyltransferase exoenzyme/F like protein
VRVIAHSLDELDTLRDEFNALVERALTLTVAGVTSRLTARGLTAGVEEDAFAVASAWETQVDETLVSHIAATYDGASLSVAYQLADGLPLAEGSGIPMVPPDPAVAYLSQARNRLAGVSDDIWQHVRTQLVAGLQAGESIEQLALRVHAAGQLSLPRARVVARTEINGASNAGAYAQLAYLGLVGKQEWLSTSDGRTRPDHALANGQKVALDARFNVGGYYLRWPGDPSAPASETVNCRCTVAFEIDDDEPPTVTCSALTAAGTPQVVTTSHCVVPPDSVPAHHDSDKLAELTDDQKKYVYQTFQFPKAISPAYGGAKIHKQVQATIDALAKTGKAELQALGPAEIVHIVDQHYQAGKFTFKQKYDEWLASKAGAKVAPHQAVTIEPKSITSESLIVEVRRNGVDKTPLGHVYAEGVDENGVSWRVSHVGILDEDYIVLEKKLASGKWISYANVNGVASLKAPSAANVKWHVPGEVTTKANLVPAKIAEVTNAAKSVQQKITDIVTPNTTVTPSVKMPAAPVSVKSVTAPSTGLALPPVPAPPKPAELKFTGKVLGSHGAQVWIDAQGQRWLFKPQMKMLTEIDRATAILQSRALHTRPGVYEIKLNGKSGSIQSMFEGDEVFAHGFDPLKLSTQEVLQLQSYHIFDWLISNHDAHEFQFLRLSDGGIAAIDKGQAFKFFTSDKLDWKWKAPGNFGTPVYDDMWRAFAEGKDIQLFDPTTGALGEFIKRLQSIPDADYRKILTPYAEQAAHFGVVPYGSVEKFLDAAIARKANLAHDFSDLYQRALAQRAKTAHVTTPGTSVTAPKVTHTPPVVKPIATVDKKVLTPVKTNVGHVPLVQQEGGIDHIPDLDQEAFYQAFKKYKITAVWSASKIWDALQKTRAEGYLVNELQALKILDRKFAEHGGSTGFVEKITKWEQSPAGKKILGAVPEGVTIQPSPTFTGPTPATPAKPKILKSKSEVEAYGATRPVGEPFAEATSSSGYTYRVFYDSFGILQGEFRQLGNVEWQPLLKSYLTKYLNTLKWKTIAAHVKLPGPTNNTPVVHPPEVSASTKSKMTAMIQTVGSPFEESPAVIYKKIAEIRTAVNAQGHTLSDLDVIRIIDAEMAAKLGLDNVFMYEKKVVEWLKTANGAQAAAKITAKADIKTSSATREKLRAEIETMIKSDRERISTRDLTFGRLSSENAFALQSEMERATSPWTAEQRAALKRYTSDSYRVMNGILRGSSSSNAESHLNAIRNAQAGMRPSTRPILTYRGTEPEQFGGAELNASMVGKVFEDKGFMSTGLTLSHAGSVVLEIECPTGTPMAFVEGITHHPGENEVMLAAGLRYQVMSVKEGNIRGYRTWVVRVRVVPH